jgi:UPF0271 protein
MSKIIDLNSDIGESFGAWTMGDDAAMMEIVTSVNVACGFHAGDPLVMHETVARARAKGIGVGAHPSFYDIWGFGRRPIQGEKPSDIEKMVVYQIGALQAVAKAVGHRVTHVKTHGSLGNMAAVDLELALAVGRAAKSLDDTMALVVMPGTEQERAGEKLGMRLAREVFADRTYTDEGQLTSRKLPGAVIHDADLAAQRVLRMVEEGAVRSAGGKKLPMRFDTICVHGDNPAAVAMARRIRADLERAGVALKPMAATR